MTRRLTSVLGGCGLAFAAGAALAQGRPMEGPFPAAIELDALGDLGLTLDGAGYSDASGWSVDAAGDFNGDGIDDVVIGAPGSYRGGGAFVVFGRRDAGTRIDLGTLDGTNGVRLNAPQEHFAGAAVAGIGDLNGDGIDDLAIGGPGQWPDYGIGVVYVVFGRDAGVEPFPASLDLTILDGTDGLRLDGVQDEDLAGASLAGVGDINGDGYDDMLVGAPKTELSGLWRLGVGYVVYGRDAAAEPFPAAMSLGDLDGTNGFTMEGHRGSGQHGSSVAAAGDLNGDGRPDMALGAPRWTHGADETMGATYVVFGREAGGEPFPAALDLGTLDGTDGVRFQGSVRYGQTATALAGTRDVNGDGLDDLVIGGPNLGPTGGSLIGPWWGASYVVFGRRVSDAGPFAPIIELGDLDGSNGVRINGTEDSGSGAGLAAAGDLDGDGLADLAIGAPELGPSPRPYGGGFVLMGRRGPWPATIDLSDPTVLDGPGGFTFFAVPGADDTGLAIAGAGDFNADGAPDLLVGSRDHFGRGHTSLIFGRVPCRADLDRDSQLTIFDFLTFQNFFQDGDPRADFDGDGELTVFDFLAFQNAFDAGCE